MYVHVCVWNIAKVPVLMGYLREPHKIRFLEKSLFFEIPYFTKIIKVGLLLTGRVRILTLSKN
jgi:hypothetical protein